MNTPALTNLLGCRVRTTRHRPLAGRTSDWVLLVLMPSGALWMTLATMVDVL